MKPRAKKKRTKKKQRSKPWEQDILRIRLAQLEQQRINDKYAYMEMDRRDHEPF